MRNFSGGKPLAQKSRGRQFLPAQLGALMKMAPNLRELRCDTFKLRVDSLQGGVLLLAGLM
jgi:hypothetical protein